MMPDDFVRILPANLRPNDGTGSEQLAPNVWAHRAPDGQPVVVKLCEDDVPGSFTRRSGLWRREVNALRLIAGGEADVVVPRMLFEQYPLIVLDDLRPMRRWKQYEGLPIAVAVAAVRAAARLHAPRWSQPESLLPLPPLVDLMTRNADQFRDSLPAFIHVYRPYVSSLVRELLERIASAGSVDVASPVDCPITALHGDYRAENVGLKADRLCVFDFGFASVGPAVFDIAHLLGGSLTAPVRRQHQRELVQSYCDELRRHGVVYRVDDAWNDYCAAMSLTLPLNVMFGTLGTGSIEQVRSRRRVARRYLTAAAELLPG